MLEGRHVIGLFCLMLLFSGVFFTLGFVMGKNQYDGQVRAATNPRSPDVAVAPKSDRDAKRATDADHSSRAADATAQPYPEWEFYKAGDPKKSEEHLKPAAPAPAPKTVNAAVKKSEPPKTSTAAAHPSLNAPLIPGGAYLLQVAALKTQSDALVLAGNLQKKRFPAFVQTPRGDKFYRVQVGPYVDSKSAEIAKKGLEAAGFKAIVKH